MVWMVYYDITCKIKQYLDIQHFQEIVNWFPVHVCALHVHMGDFFVSQPVAHFQQVVGHGTKSASLLNLCRNHASYYYLLVNAQPGARTIYYIHYLPLSS